MMANITIDPYQAHAAAHLIERLREEISALRKERDDIALLVTSTKAELNDQLTRYRAVMEMAVEALKEGIDDYWVEHNLIAYNNLMTALREVLKM